MKFFRSFLFILFSGELLGLQFDNKDCMMNGIRLETEGPQIGYLHLLKFFIVDFAPKLEIKIFFFSFSEVFHRTASVQKTFLTAPLTLTLSLVSIHSLTVYLLDI